MLSATWTKPSGHQSGRGPTLVLLHQMAYHHRSRRRLSKYHELFHRATDRLGGPASVLFPWVRSIGYTAFNSSELTLEIPERNINASQRTHEHGSATVEGFPPRQLPDLFNVARLRHFRQ